MWCWRRLLRVPSAARRSNQSILREINPEHSLEGLMLKLKLQYFGHLIWTVDSLEKSLNGTFFGVVLFTASCTVLWTSFHCSSGILFTSSYPLNICYLHCIFISSVQSLSHVWLFATHGLQHQASLSITNSRSLLKLMSIELVISFNHLILCCPFLLLPSIFPTIRVFSNEPVFHIRWPKYWSFSFSISPPNEYSRLVSFRFDWFDFLAVQGTLKSLIQHHSSAGKDWGQKEKQESEDEMAG